MDIVSICAYYWLGVGSFMHKTNCLRLVIQVSFPQPACVFGQFSVNKHPA